jgi:nucleoside-diphosphate-sugar epimerase
MTEALHGGVQHIVKVSAFVAGLDRPISFGRQHSIAEKHLQASGMRWTILRPYMFMQNFLKFADTISTSSLLVAPFGQGRVSFVDCRDVANVAFQVLMNADRHVSKVYEVTGPMPISFKEAAKILSDVRGQRVRYLSPPEWIAKIGLRRSGMSKWEANMIIELSRLIKANGEINVTDTVRRVGNKSPHSFRQFVDDNKEAFSKHLQYPEYNNKKAISFEGKDNVYTGR